MKQILHILPSMLAAAYLAGGCTSSRPAGSFPVPDILERLSSGQSSDGSGPRAEIDLERQALARDPELRPFRSAVEEARAELGAAVEWRDPELRASYGESDSTYTNAFRPDETGEQAELALRIYPPHLWNIRPLRDAARARFHAAEADLMHQSWQTVSDVRALGAETAFLRRRIELKEEFIGLLKEKKKLLAELAEQGGVTAMDVVDLSSDLMGAAMQEADLRLELQQRQTELAARTGIAEYLADDNWNSGPGGKEPDACELADRAARERFDLVALAWRAEAARADRRAETGRKIPSLSHVQISQGSQEEDSREEDSWEVQAAVEIPVFSLAGRSEERFLKIEERNLADELSARVRQVRMEVQMAADRHAAALKALRAMRREADALLKEYDALTKGDNVPLNALQKVDIRLKSVAVREWILRAEYNALDAWHALARACGAEPVNP